MKYYFIAQIKVHDEEEYEKYLEKCDDVFSKFKGEYLAVDRSPVLLEGNWDYTKSVLIRFNSKKEFEEWYYSDDYQKIIEYRLKASMCDTILIEGAN